MLDLQQRCGLLGCTQTDVEHMAYVAYEAHRCYRHTLGTYDIDQWSLADQDEKNAARAMVIHVLEVPPEHLPLDLSKKTAIFRAIVQIMDPRRASDGSGRDRPTVSEPTAA